MQGVDAPESGRQRKRNASRPVLIVSPERTDAIPVLEKLLRGDPEIEIVVDRRVSDRRVGSNGEEEAVPDAERREGQRRVRPATLYLV